eukprot:CCRYP_014046-RA/>CCRYP_014046-RA protein AED:0.23 eAED:1.00 QI:0/-1/0/1/-1/0/1/0/102
MGILQTMHSDNTAVSKGKQLLIVESTHTSRMTLRKEQLGTSLRQKNNVATCKSKMAKCGASLFMVMCGQDGCVRPQHCASAAGWKITIRTIFWHQRGNRNER